MKILICGEGGYGKSTIAALLAKEMAVRGNKASYWGLIRIVDIIPATMVF